MPDAIQYRHIVGMWSDRLITVTGLTAPHLASISSTSSTSWDTSGLWQKPKGRHRDNRDNRDRRGGVLAYERSSHSPWGRTWVKTEPGSGPQSQSTGDRSDMHWSAETARDADTMERIASLCCLFCTTKLPAGHPCQQNNYNSRIRSHCPLSQTLKRGFTSDRWHFSPFFCFSIL